MQNGTRTETEQRYGEQNVSIAAHCVALNVVRLKPCCNTETGCQFIQEVSCNSNVIIPRTACTIILDKPLPSYAVCTFNNYHFQYTIMLSHTISCFPENGLLFGM